MPIPTITKQIRDTNFDITDYNQPNIRKIVNTNSRVQNSLNIKPYKPSQTQWMHIIRIIKDPISE